MAGLSVDEIDTLLNRRSGVLGLSGVSDFRDLHRLIAAGDANAALALDVWVHRVRSYIGAYYAVLGSVDAITFTAGVGENDARARELVHGRPRRAWGSRSIRSATRRRPARRG